MSEREVWIVERKATADEAVVFLADGTPRSLPTSLLPIGVESGDRLIVERERSRDRSRVVISRDPEATDAARDQVSTRLDRLRRRDPGGDRSV